MVAINGEVLTINRRLKHSAGSSLGDGEPVSSGVAMILDSNLSHLQVESVRHLGTCLLPSAAAYQGSGYGQIIDRVKPPSGGDVGASIISWSHKVSRVFGPHDIVADRDLGDGRRVLRKVRVKIRAYSATGSSLSLHTALMVGPLPPHQDSATPIVMDSATPGAGIATTTLTLTADGSFRPAETQLCRGGSEDPASSVFAGLHVWVGWLSTSASDRLVSISVYEVR